MSKHLKTLTRTNAVCLLAISCLLAALCLAGCSPEQAPLPTATQIIPPSATPTVTFLPDATLFPMAPADAPFTVTSHLELSGKIAFVGSDGGGPLVLYTMNADGTGLSQFIGIPSVGYYLAWSPDGKQIAYSEEPLSFYINVMNADGSGHRQLPASFRGGGALFWEPDGQRIRFVSKKREQGQRCVYVVKADGSGAPELYNPFNIPQLCGRSSPQDLAWAPDGTKFALGTLLHNDKVLNIDGSVIGRNLGGLNNTWSPDGRKLAFTLTYGVFLYIVNSDGSEETLVSTTPLSIPDDYEAGLIELAWSPDGKKIAIVLGCEIAVIDIDGSNLIKLVDGCKVDTQYFFWSISWTR